MPRHVSHRKLSMIMLICIAALLAFTLGPARSSALPDYAAKTGQPCGTCHVNPAGGGSLTAKGQAFAAISTHAADPAGAFAQVSGAPAVGSLPASSGQVAATISGAAQDDSVVYSIVVRNTGDKPIVNVYVAGSIPAGASFSGVASTPDAAGSPTGGPIPVDAGFSSSDGGNAAWLLDTVPAKTSVGPFAYRVTRGSATDLSATAFVHWLQPNEGTATSASSAPESNSDRLADEQIVNNKLNSLDRSLTLWNIQPGLGTVMIEYATRFANLWFAAQEGNWRMAHYQVQEMTEIQEVGETTRPGRAPALKNFESTYLDPLIDAAQAKDLTSFTTAYDKAIQGCNACHASQTGAPGGGDFGFVKIQRPTRPVLTDVDWSGQ